MLYLGSDLTGSPYAWDSRHLLPTQPQHPWTLTECSAAPCIPLLPSISMMGPPVAAGFLPKQAVAGPLKGTLCLLILSGWLGPGAAFLPLQSSGIQEQGKVDTA